MYGLKSAKLTRGMASGPIISWEVNEETVETVSDFIFWGYKITADGDCTPGNKPETSAPFSLSSHVFLRWTLFTGQLEERTTTGDLSGRRDRSLHSFLSRKKAQTQLMLTLDFLAQLT